MENDLDVLSSQRNIWVSNPPYLSLLERKKKKKKRKKEGRKEKRKEGKKERKKFLSMNNKGEHNSGTKSLSEKVFV